jgi:hypothetical protein
MTDGFDPVAVRIAQEGCVIGRVIPAQTRCTIVAAAGRQTGRPERVDYCSRPRLEAPMTGIGLVRRRPFPDCDIDSVRVNGIGPLAIANPIWTTSDFDDAERVHHRVIKPFRGNHVRRRDIDMIQHG